MFTPENSESEPDWVKTEKNHFVEFRDTNKVFVCRLLEMTASHKCLFV